MILGSNEEDDGLSVGLISFIVLPSFLCFILLKSDTANLGVGLTVWAFVTSIIILGQVFSRRAREMRGTRRRR